MIVLSLKAEVLPVFAESPLLASDLLMDLDCWLPHHAYHVPIDYPLLLLLAVESFSRVSCCRN